MYDFYRMTKPEIIEYLNLLFEHLGQYPISQAISDEIDRTVEYLNELED